MARTVFNFKVTNKLSDYIKVKAELTGKGIDAIEEDLAAHCGLKAGTFKKYKKGNIFPSVPALLKIGQYFNCPIEKIYELKEE